MRRGTWAAAALLGLSAIALPPVRTRAAAPSQPPLEQAVKASFLFKFAPFVEWPAGAAGKYFHICVRGEDPFGNVLDDVVRGQKISGRPVGIKRLGRSDPSNGCQMLFAGRMSGGDYAPFADVAGRPVLTVTDADNGVPGAMIQFVKQDGRIRFQIDNVGARASALVISSKLLGLAVPVEHK